MSKIQDKLIAEQKTYLDMVTAEVPYRRVTESDKTNARAELAQLRARIDALENDIVCAFCGTHYKADDVPPKHYLTCEQSPLVQRIAEKARQLEAARKLEKYVRDLNDYEVELTACPVCDYPPIICECQYTNIRSWLAANPAPKEEPHP